MSNPRYRNATELLQLAIALQGATVGYTIDEIQAQFDITRKTAERRLNALRELFPNSLEYQTFDGRKRHWRLRDGHVSGLIRLEPEELATATRRSR